MNKLFENLQAELDKIFPEDYIEPVEVVNENNETLLGECSEEIKKMYTLSELHAHNTDELINQLKHDRSQQRKRELFQKLISIIHSRDFWRALVWVSVSKQFPSAFSDTEEFHCCFGLREKFQVVLQKHETPFYEIIKNLFFIQ
jgi:hypothetical protein